MIPYNAFSLPLHFPTYEKPGAALRTGGLVQLATFLVIAALLVGCSAAAATTLVQAPTDSAPVLTVEPDHGPLQTVTLIGRNFPAHAALRVRMGAPNTGLNAADLAWMNADEDGAFIVSVPLPALWPGANAAVVEEQLVLAVIDPSLNQTLATVIYQQPAARITPTPDLLAGCDASILAAAEPVAIVMAEALDILAGATAGATPVTRVDRCQPMSVSGRDAGGVWVKVELPGGYRGWAASASLRFNVAVNVLPVVE
ncbi:MAG TPA: SH3 domain-containing protein [Chloroflexi bacterium]|nr:SH3 domain-containing protein [Chloroflexota bacterium]